ncbi:hypothetical protein LCGC14_1935460, partial [marine sediment metagenome]
MSEIRLTEMVVSNFKGIKRFVLSAGDQDATVYGDNATGKTTLIDAYLWLLRGKDSRDNAAFEIKALEVTATPYPVVTIVTHGFQPSLTIGNPDENQPQGFLDLAHMIVDAGGGGRVLKYIRSEGTWQDDKSMAAGAIAAEDGKPLVLVLDWNKESNITDSGFSEAAADTFFASMVQLDNE